VTFPVYNILGTGRRFTVKEYLIFQERLRERRREMVLICDHPETITAGIQARPDDMKIHIHQLKLKNIDYVETRRAGGYTSHEPGQIVIYPHVDLSLRNIGISKFYRTTIMITLECIKNIWGITTYFDESLPGLYTEKGHKILSAGIDAASHFTSHGFALNVNNSLTSFQYINPCGIKDRQITSILLEGGDIKKADDFINLWMLEFGAFISGGTQS